MKQKFAWKPKKVWNMRTKNEHFSWIWLCWYWNDGYDSDEIYYTYKDEKITLRRYTRMRSNYW